MVTSTKLRGDLGKSLAQATEYEFSRCCSGRDRLQVATDGARIQYNLDLPKRSRIYPGRHPGPLRFRDSDHQVYSYVYSCRVSRAEEKETGVGSTDDIRFKTIELLPRHNIGGRETIPDPTLNGVHEVRGPAETSALALAPAAKAETSTTHLSPSSWISSTVYSRPDCCSMSLRALARLSR